MKLFRTPSDLIETYRYSLILIKDRYKSVKTEQNVLQFSPDSLKVYSDLRKVFKNHLRPCKTP